MFSSLGRATVFLQLKTFPDDIAPKWKIVHIICSCFLCGSSKRAVVKFFKPFVYKQDTIYTFKRHVDSQIEARINIFLTVVDLFPV